MFDFLHYAPAVYTVVGFTPPDPAESTMGRWGFEVRLSLKFAQACSIVPLQEDHQDRLNSRMRDTVVRRMFDADRVDERPILRFVNNTWLLHSVEVPGVNGCMLYLDPTDVSLLLQMNHVPGLTQAITFVTHNVDSATQAFALLSCWLHWHRVTCSNFYNMEHRR